MRWYRARPPPSIPGDQLGDAGLVSTSGRWRTYRPDTGLDRAAYRIIQEALTNVLRHADATSATVWIAYRPDGLELIIHDSGGGDAQAVDGRGIAGMRERAASLGGTLDAGPDAGGGFSVRARLPLPAVPT
jgi:signal transduction histidine kinase